MMNIAGTQFTMDKNAFEIYLSGCNHKCSAKCHNKELWSFSVGHQYNKEFFEKIKRKVSHFDDLINCIVIFGGEPLDQNHEEFLDFMKDIKSIGKELWLFTSYELNEVPEDIMKLCDYIKTGTYNDKFPEKHEQYGYVLASSNQKIHKIS